MRKEGRKFIRMEVCKEGSLRGRKFVRHLRGTLFDKDGVCGVLVLFGQFLYVRRQQTNLKKKQR